MKFKNVTLIAITLISFFSLNATAGDDFGKVNTLTQKQLSELTTDLGAGFSYKPMLPASSLGVVGFNVGVSAHYSDVQNLDSYKKANGNNSKSIQVTRITAVKGLPGGFDLGASISKIGDGTLIGFQISNELLADSIATPAVSLSANYTQSVSSNNIKFQDIGIESTISKNFLMVTPYAGLGFHQSKLTAKNSNLSSERKSQTRAFVGAKVSFGILDIGLEFERFGKTETKSIKFSVGL